METWKRVVLVATSGSALLFGAYLGGAFENRVVLQPTETPTPSAGAQSTEQSVRVARRQSPAPARHSSQPLPTPQEEPVSTPRPEPEPEGTQTRMPIIETRPDREVETPPPSGGDTLPQPKNPQPKTGSATPRDPSTEPPKEVVQTPDVVIE